MKRLFARKNLGVTMLLILSLFMQIVMPVVPHFAYAESGEQSDVQEQQGEDTEDSNVEDVAEDMETDDIESEAVEEDTELEDRASEEVEENVDVESDETEREDKALVEDEKTEETVEEAKSKAEAGVGLASAGKDLGNIFTDIKLTVDGEEIADTGSNIIIEDGTQVSITLDWVLLDEVDLQAGDWSQIKLPDVFQKVKENGKLYANGVEVGTYEITEDNFLRATFNDELVGLKERSGEVGILLKFNLEEFEDNNQQEVEFGEPISKGFTITLKPGGNHKVIEKSGKPDKDINAKYIDWYIDVNRTFEEIKNAKVEDSIPEGLVLEEGSIEVYRLTVGADGEERSETKVEDTFDSFPVELGDINSAYRIRYRTKIVDFNQDGYENKATLLEDEEKKGEATYEVDKITKSTLIEKTGVANNGGKDSTKITWYIDVNKAEETLNNVKIVDTLPEGLTLDSDSMRVWKLVNKGDQWDYSDEITESLKDEGKLKLPLELGDIDTAYRIVFDTDIEYKEYKPTNEFENKAELLVNEEKEDEAKYNVTVNRSTLIQKNGKETTSYGKPEIKWTIEVNNANHKIKDATITDNIGDGLKLREGSIELLNHKNEKVELQEAPDFPRIEDVEDNKFVLKLGDIYSKYTIIYITDITDPDIELKNQGELKGDGLSGVGIEDGIIKTPEVIPGNKVVNQYNKTKANSNKTIDEIKYNGIDYAAKTMSWVITIDAIKEEIIKLKLEDSFDPEGSMVFLEDSLRVIKLEDKKEVVLTEGTDYTLTDNGKGGFELNFKGELDRTKYQVFYKTSFDPDEVLAAGGELNPNKQYNNKVNFIVTTKDIKENSKDIDVERDANYSIQDVIFNGGTKNGRLDREGRKITWEIYVNALGQDLKGQDFVITDTLSQGQEFDEKSLVVKMYELLEGGSFKIGEELDAGKYEVVKNDEGFTLTIPGGIDKPYIIEYTTNIVGISEKTYTNTAGVKGKGLDKSYKKSVNYKDYDKFIVKDATNTDGNIAYTDDEIEWKVTLNESLSDIKEAVFKDTISSGHVYLKDSIKLYKGSVSEENEVELKEGDPKVTTDSETGVTVLELTLGDIDSVYIVTYKTVIVATDGEISNSASLRGKEFDEKGSGEKKFSVTQASWGTGSGKPRGKISITKIDAETRGKIANNPAEFELYYSLNGEERIVNGAAMETENGEIRYGNLPYRTYYLREKAAPKGYELLSKAPEGYKLVKGAVEIVVDKENQAIEIEIENTKQKIAVTGTKVWDGGPKEKPTIELQLYRDGEKLGDPVELENGKTEYTWTDLDKTDIDGKEYTYTVDEVNAPDNYKKDVDGLVVTNTYVSPKTEITGTKVWVDGPKDRPTIELQLYRDGEKLGDPVKLENDETEYTWTDLDLTDRDGRKYVYTVDEVEVPENYEKTVSKDGLTVTNTYVSPKTEKTGKKVWENGPEERPSIELQLYRDGEKFGKPVALKDGKTEHTWADLDLTDKNGVPYNYTVDEVKVPENYEKEVDGLTVTNSYVIPKIDVTGEKVWIDGPKDRPTIKLQLYRDGEELGDPVELENAKTEYTWTDLDKTDIDGKEYVYTVDEVNAPDNYKKEADGLVVTNTYVSPKTEVTGTKVWINGPEEKPAIQLQLYRDGEPLGKPVALEGGKTEYTWTDLDLTDKDGNEYVYTVDEVEVPENYKKDVDGLTITNSYEIPKIDVTGKKAWIDGPKDRPTIELQLYRDGEPLGDPVKLENGETEYTWAALDKTDIAGKEYVYTVDEVNAPDNYKKEADGLVVTNTYISPKTEITGTKVWKGGPKDRPTIELQLYRDGKAFGKPVTLKNGEESYTWTDLDATDEDGVAYKYTVDEVEVPENYEKAISKDGLTITNSYVEPEKPKDPVKPEKPKGPGLPKTGATTNIAVILMGVALIAIGVGLNKKRA